MNQLLIKQKLEQFLLEDIGVNDWSAATIFSQAAKGEATFIVKKPGILSGLSIITETYQLLDASIEVTTNKSDGDKVSKGETIAVVKGPIKSILTGERVILNLVQRMSGIATMTHKAVQLLNSTHTRICDTRKTTPGLRIFEKYAVTCGGGFNHRFGLDDGVMIKDNHIAFCGSIETAVRKAREKLGPMIKIEVETESEQEVEMAIAAGCDIIMFDNQPPEVVKAWNKLVPDSIITEASGNITLDNIASFHDTGVDFISLGCLTHSVASLDISLGGI